MSKLIVQSIIINVDKTEFISLTDMLQAKDGNFLISDWLRNRNTVEFLGIWEKIHNPKFNYGELAKIKSRVGLNNYKLSVKEWIAKTNAVGIRATTGRYGGTYAHKDIAFEFGMWISAEFKIYLIKEFRRLKEKEYKNLNLEWNIKRQLSKINYEIHSNAIKENLIPPTLCKKQIQKMYSDEADILNMALFGKTAKEWENENKAKEGNMRDYASITQLVCLSNLESLNAVFIEEKINSINRLKKLNKIAIKQMKILTNNKQIKEIENKSLVNTF